MCISNIGNRRPFPTNGFQSRGTTARDASSSSSSSVVDTTLLKASLNNNNYNNNDVNSSSKNPHIVVQHDYHDHAQDVRVDYQEDQPARGGVTVPFPLRLHEMLDAVVANGHEHIVSWQPHGRCFVVHQPKEFIELLPHYFKLSKLASFQRQLNLYGFQRLTRGRDRGGYYHELFLRDRVFLAHSIQRIKVKGTGVRARSNPDQEPDFWAMPWVSTTANKNNDSKISPDGVVSDFQDDDDNDELLESMLRAISSDESSSSVSSSSSSSCSTAMPSPNELSSMFDGGRLHRSTATGFPPSFFAQKLPLHLEPTAFGPTETDQKDDDDDVLFGKHFFDVEKMISLLPPPQRQQPDEVGDEDGPLLAEVDAFFEDFDFPDDIGDAIEDDQVFGELLEQMVS